MNDAPPPYKGFCKRIIPCLDVDSNGRTVKGIQFQGLRDIGDPVEMALEYEKQGADELVFLDISASHEGRKTLVDLVKRISHDLRIPFTVGGGISSLDQVLALLDAGADKVSINSAAVRNPRLIQDIAEHCGSQCCVLAIDAKRADHLVDGRASWDVLVKGGRERTGLDALNWAKQAVALGTGEILLTSFDRDGTGDGFDNELNRQLAEALPVPIIASGGASGPESFLHAFQDGKADAALAATIFHDGHWDIQDLKHVLFGLGIPLRLPF
jgi:cyclase